MKTFFVMISILEQEENQQQIDMGKKPEKVAVNIPQEKVPTESPELEPEAQVNNTETPGDLKHYMFFGNLKVMKSRIEEILGMDAHKIDKMLEDGHDWAADHVSTSRDDIEEVYNWIVGTKK